MIKITLEVQEFKPDQVIKPLVNLMVTAGQGDKIQVLTSLLRECQTELFRMDKEEYNKRLERQLEREF